MSFGPTLLVQRRLTNTGEVTPNQSTLLLPLQNIPEPPRPEELPPPVVALVPSEAANVWGVGRRGTVILRVEPLNSARTRDMSAS